MVFTDRRPSLLNAVLRYPRTGLTGWLLEFEDQVVGFALLALKSQGKARVGKGKKKKFALQVKRKARGKLAKRKRLLFKQTVRAGGAKATVYKRLKLVRR